MAETNKLLQSIGAGVNLNMTDVVEKQVRDMLTRFKNEIQKAAAQTTQFANQAAKGLGNAGTQIQTLLNSTQKLNSDGSITETRKGYDKLGQSITEVYRAGQLLNRSMAADSALSKDVKYANELYREQLDALRKPKLICRPRGNSGQAYWRSWMRWRSTHPLPLRKSATRCWNSISLPARICLPANPN